MTKDLDLILGAVNKQVNMDLPYLIFFCASYNLRITDFMLLREGNSSRLQVYYAFETEQGRPVGVYDHKALIPLLQNAMQLVRN